jgi:hypothetical protein
MEVGRTLGRLEHSSAKFYVRNKLDGFVPDALRRAELTLATSSYNARVLSQHARLLKEIPSRTKHTRLLKETPAGRKALCEGQGPRHAAQGLIPTHKPSYEDPALTIVFLSGSYSMTNV